MKSWVLSLARARPVSFSRECLRTCCSGYVPLANDSSRAAGRGASTESSTSEDVGSVARKRRKDTFSLPTTAAPEELQTALKNVLKGELFFVFAIQKWKVELPQVTFTISVYKAHPAKQLVSDGQVLQRHLMSQKTLSRVQESKRRKQQLKVVPGADSQV